MKKIPNWIIVTGLLVLLFISKFIFFGKNEEQIGPGKAKPSMPLAVNYYVAKSEDLSNDIFTTGKVGSFNQVDLLPEVSGKVTGIYFKEGENVNKGSLLVKLNDADLQAQLLKTKSQLRLSDQKLERLKKLLAINGISQEEYDMQDNESQSLKADEAFLTAQIAKTSVVAPFTGIIGLKNISEGSFVSANTPIASMVQLKPLFIEFSIPEKYSALFKKGSAIKFSNDNVSDVKTFTASIYAVEPKVDETTKTIRARALYSGNEEFYPGSFVKVYVNMSETKNALMIPTQCIIAVLKGQKVFVSKNGLAVEAPVKIGVRTATKIQVLEGLQPGDTVIATGLMSVKKDSKLTLLKPVN